MTITRKYYVEANGSREEVKDVYESFSGWYWFITDNRDKEEQFGLVVGFETEWGYVWMQELQEQIRKGTVWKVPKKNWFSISHIQTEEAEVTA